MIRLQITKQLTLHVLLAMYNIIAYVHYLTDSFKNMNYKEHVILGQPNLNVAWANRDSLFFILSPDS